MTAASASTTFAHELDFNLSRRHQPPSAAAGGLALIQSEVSALQTAKLDKSTGDTALFSPFVQRFVGWAYFPDVTRRREPLASPRLDPDLVTAMPPTLVLTAEHDTLAGEGAELVEVLRAGGVEVAHHCYPGADHGFVAERPVERVRDALERMSHFLQDHVGGTVRVVLNEQERS